MADKEKDKSIFAEFREFISRGNMIDLAVGLTVGTAFTQLVNALVNDLVMPPIGYVLNNIDFNNLYINLSTTDYSSLADAEAAGAPIIKYGHFITAMINFFIIAVVIFVLVKAINKLRRQQAEEDKKEIKKEVKKELKQEEAKKKS
jgi:large conductance mechanosensitive channel